MSYGGIRRELGEGTPNLGHSLVTVENVAKFDQPNNFQD